MYYVGRYKQLTTKRHPSIFQIALHEIMSKPISVHWNSFDKLPFGLPQVNITTKQTLTDIKHEYSRSITPVFVNSNVFTG